MKVVFSLAEPRLGRGAVAGMCWLVRLRIPNVLGQVLLGILGVSPLLVQL